MIDENYFKTRKSAFFGQHMVNDINDDDGDDIVMMIMKLVQGVVRSRNYN